MHVDEQKAKIDYQGEMLQTLQETNDSQHGQLQSLQSSMALLEKRNQQVQQLQQLIDEQDDAISKHSIQTHRMKSQLDKLAIEND